MNKDALSVEIGRRIKFLRLKDGLDQATMGRMLGIEQTYISKLENGSISPNIRVIAKVCWFYGQTISKFLEGL